MQINRSGARFHSGGFSWGCVTVDKYGKGQQKGWDDIKKMMNNTQTGQIGYDPGKRWYQFGSNPVVPITLYGTVTVKP